MSFNDDEQIAILKDAPSGKKVPTFVAGKIQIEVNNFMEAPLEETRFKVLLELTELGDIEGRPELDLVIVIDISRSMRKGVKLDKLKIAMQYLVKKLSPVDRFSIVTFFDSSNRLFPLRQITADSKAKIIEEIRLLKAKNSDKNIAEGLRMALKVLNDRRFAYGRVGAIMLFSDGDENRGKAAEVDVSNVPVHTFSFDASHDQRVLKEIAMKSNGGTFSDLQNENNLNNAFSQCLAGLLPIVVPDLRLKVAPVNTESIINKVLVGNYPTETKNSAVTIFYGDLYRKEVHKVLVELLLPNIVESGPRAEDVLRITCSYSDGYGKERFKAEPIRINVTRTGPKEITQEDEIKQKDKKR
ncbi:hypothetical protein L484_002393 [Morus notabilis]|uniref:VWFA domain-containing protein n=1 Tax=Morus notabilis TaxID=981085 RepID=W9R7W9_9ROSA|nr:hypothetical protein L484_002393 [Morus notabilis]